MFYNSLIIVVSIYNTLLNSADLKVLRLSPNLEFLYYIVLPFIYRNPLASIYPILRLLLRLAVWSV